MKALKISEILPVLLVTFGLLLLSGSLFGAWAGKAVFFLTQMTVFIAMIAFIKLRGLSMIATLRWRPPKSYIWKYLVILSLSATVILDEIDKLLIATGIIPPEFLYRVVTIYSINSMSDVFWLMLGVGVAAPWVEESIFRGFIQSTFESKYSIPVAIILTSILFSLMHLQPYWYIQLTILSIIAGYCSWKFDSIFPGVVIHAVNNIWTLILINNLTPKLEKIYSPSNHVNIIVLFLASLGIIYSLYKLNNGNLK